MPDLTGMLRILIVVVFFSFSASAQKQLVLLKFGKPVGRFTEGDYMYFIMKDGTKREGMIIELLEFSIITSNDTVQFNKIDKIGIPKGERRGVAPLTGGLLFAGGAIYLGLDLVNSALGYNPEGVDRQVVTSSAVLMGVGGALLFIKPKWRRVNNGTFLRTIDYKSKFYKTPGGGH